jgi:hypothetical protein
LLKAAPYAKNGIVTTLLTSQALLAATVCGLLAPAFPLEPLPIDLLKLPRSERLAIPRLYGPLTLDGMSNEPAWQEARPFPLIMHMPKFGEPPSERSEALLAFDDEFLYVAGRLFDREPFKIQAPTKKRDAATGSSEWFGIILDTFNDKENGLGFFTTPSGLRWDAAIFNDAQPATSEDSPINRSWNVFWDVATARTQEGWFIEMRIPISSLRFQNADGRVVMGLIISRWIARKNELDVFPAIPRNWGEMSNWKLSQAQEVEFLGLRPRNPFYITPYLLAGHSRASDLNHEETAYLATADLKFEMGLDVKCGLASNITVDLTANTDFAQVEADEAQVNLTRFSLFFPEKRLFFQERSSNFEFGLGGQDRLFYSRKIGLFEGRAVRIYGGARIVGRIGGWDLGFLNMQTAAGEGRPSENFGVLRVRRRVFNAFSYVGGIITSRIGRDGSFNTAYGLDGILRLFGDDYLTFDWAQVFKTGASNRALSLNPTQVNVAWKRSTKIGPAYLFNFSRSGLDFDPGLGFQTRQNYTRLSWCGQYGWAPRKETFLVQHDAYLEGQVYWDNGSGRVESVEIGPGWEFAAKSGWSGSASPRFFIEDISEEFSLSDKCSVPAGRYSFVGLKGMVLTPQGNLLSSTLTLEAGSFYDGWRISVGAAPTWSAVPDLELSGLFQYNAIRFPSRGQIYIAPLARLSVLATLSTQFSASAFIQYDGGTGAVIANVRFRYNPKEGTDICLIYNGGLNTGRFQKTPVAPLSSGRAVLLKASTTFNF